MKEPKMTWTRRRVLYVLLNSQKALAGSEIRKKSGVFSGTLYPTLINLENAGWLKSYMEDGNPSELARPLRRYYYLTERGMSRAKEHLAEINLNEDRFFFTS